MTSTLRSQFPAKGFVRCSRRLRTWATRFRPSVRGGWVDQVGGMPLEKIRLYLEGKGIDADVFLAETAFQREVITRRVTCTVEGQPVSLVTAEDLILFKLIASRPRDLLDVQDVLFTQGDLDEAYMRQWAKELGVAEKLEEVLSQRA